MLIIDEVITTSGFSEVILEVLNTPIGLDIVENMTMIWNQVEISINGEVITTSGFSEAILDVLKRPIGVGMVERMIMIWNQAKMLIRCKVITTSGFCGSHFGGPKMLHWICYSWKDE